MRTSAAWVALAISIGPANPMAYDKQLLQAKPGEPIELTVRNAADPSTRLQHDWVLVKPGAKEEVALKAAGAGAAHGYVPPDDPNVLAHTRLLTPGTQETLRFKAPLEPGDYPYFCSVPAHSDILKGVLRVAGK